MTGDTDGKKHLLISEKLESMEAMVGYIETKAESLDTLLMQRKPIRELSNEIKNIFDMVLDEHSRVDEQQKTDMLNRLADRLMEFSRTMEGCKRLVDVLHRRNNFTAGLMRVWDLRKVKRLQEEVKMRGVDLERRLTRLKIDRAKDERTTKSGSEILEGHQEQQLSSKSSNVPSAVNRTSDTNIAPAMNPPTMFANAKDATIKGGSFSASGKDTNCSTLCVRNSRNVVIHNHNHFHSCGHNCLE